MVTDTTGVSDGGALRTAARAAGLRKGSGLTLDAVDARRSQLWLVTFGVSAALGLALLAIGLAGPAVVGVVSATWGVRLGAVILVAALALHVVDQERRLRHMTRLLVSEHDRVRHLERLTTHDAATGLLNRPAFRDRVAASLARSRRHDTPLTVLVVDLGVVERSHHPEATVAEIAHRLRLTVRGEDAVGRLGPDRIGVVGDDVTDIHGARALAHRLLAEATEPLDHAGAVVATRPSLGGVVHLGGHKDGADDLLRDAEMAANLARRRGGERIELYDRVATLAEHERTRP